VKLGPPPTVILDSPATIPHTSAPVHPIFLVVCLLIVLVILVTVARRLSVSHPIVLVIGGLLLALCPGLPDARLEPDIVFLVFLPPLLYWDALNCSWRDFREHWRPISALAIGLVFATAMAVMVTAHFILGFPWGPAFVLGSVLGPTDTVAAAAILEQFNLPRNLLAVIRGESLLNDALALVLFETALHVTQTGSFVWGSISAGFCIAAAGGILIGLGVGWLMLRVRRFTGDPLTGNTISLLTAFAAYLPADAAHVSGVLAVVSAGLYIGWKYPRMLSAKFRLQLVATWETIAFLLNGLLFILIGLQLRGIIGSLPGGSIRSILRACLLISATVILARILWVFVSKYLQGALSRRLHQRSLFSPWQHSALISWVGMRGGISLAAALAIPHSLSDGSPFPRRSEILILTFAVILVTLVLQGLSLPRLLRRLKLSDAGAERAEEYRTREALTDAALQYLAAALPGDEIQQRAVKQLQDSYRNRAEGFETARSAHLDKPEAGYMTRLISLERDLVGLQRTTLIDLRDVGTISDDVRRRFEVLLDLEEAHLAEEQSRWST
jgi:monovalent cation/hydrogen antiporter